MRIERKAGGHTIVSDSQAIGNDLIVIIYGGDEHHIGGISVAYPTKSHYRDAFTISLNSITLPGHKDYVLANSLAEKLAEALRRVVTVVVGIHMDNATEDDIKRAVETSHLMTDEIIAHYSNKSPISS